jgi:hypothetical protein
MSTIPIPTGMKKNATESRNAGRRRARIAQRRSGPPPPSPRWRNGIQAVRPTNAAPAARASTPVTSLAVSACPSTAK